MVGEGIWEEGWGDTPCKYLRKTAVTKTMFILISLTYSAGNRLIARKCLNSDVYCQILVYSLHEKSLMNNSIITQLRQGLLNMYRMPLRLQVVLPVISAAWIRAQSLNHFCNRRLVQTLMHFVLGLYIAIHAGFFLTEAKLRIIWSNFVVGLLVQQSFIALL